MQEISTWDFSTHLVEWLELLRGFGVARVMAYTLQVDPVSFCFKISPRCTKNLPQVDTNVSRVLAHYQSLGFLHLTPFSLAGHQPNLHLLRVIIFIFLCKDYHRNGFLCRRSSWQTELSIEGRSSYLLTITAFTGFDCLLVW